MPNLQRNQNGGTSQNLQTITSQVIPAFDLISSSLGALFMRLDRYDIFPLSIVLLFGFVIPFGLWLGFGTRQQISHDLWDIAKTFTVVSLAFSLLVECLGTIARRREKQILAERGEQSSDDFVVQFTSDPERRAATLVFDTLRDLTAVKQMPTLRRGDQLSGSPLFLAQEDLGEGMQNLFERLDFSLWLDPDGASALYSARTVEQLVLALAHFIEQQGANSFLISSSDC